MKKITIALVVAVGLVAFSATAQGKWWRLGWSSSGNWALSDRLVKAEGACKTVVVAIGYKRVRPHRIYGPIAGKKAVYKVCCPAKTLQALGIVLINPRGKAVYRYRVRERASSPRAGTIADRLVKVVCSPGFGGRGPGAR